jgi:hypothetical protein
MTIYVVDLEKNTIIEEKISVMIEKSIDEYVKKQHNNKMWFFNKAEATNHLKEFNEISAYIRYKK